MPTYLDIQRLRAREPLPRPVLGQELLAPPPEKPSIGAALKAGFRITNFISEGIAFANKSRPENKLPDPQWNPSKFLRDNDEFAWLLELMRHDEGAFDAVAATNNQEEFMALAENQKKIFDEYRDFGESPVAGITGAVAGAILDLPLLIVPGVGIAKGLATAAKTTRAARKIGAARLATLGAVENTAFEGLRSQRDVTVGLGEMLAAGAIGAAFGGLIGGAFPRTAGIAVNPSLAEATRARRAAQPDRPFDRTSTPPPGGARPEPQPASVGAAASDAPADLPFRSAALGSGTLRHLPFSTFFTGIKSRWLNNLSRFQGDVAVEGFVREFNKIVRQEALNRGEALGTTVRSELNFQELQQQYFGAQWLGKWRLEINDEYQKLAEELSDGFMKRQARNPVFRAWGDRITRLHKPGLDRTEFRKMTHWFALHEQQGLDSDEVFRRFLPNDLSQADFARVRKAVQAAAERTDDMMQRAWTHWHDLGLVDEAQPPMPWYIPQHWLRENMMADETQALDFLKYNMELEPADDWLVAEGFMQPGGRWHDLSADVRAEAEDAWTTARAEQVQEAADKALALARNELGEAEVTAQGLVLSRFDGPVAELQDKIHFWETRLAGASDLDAEHLARVNLGKAEENLNDLLEKAERANLHMQTHKGLLQQLKKAKQRARSREEKAAILKAQRALQSAERKVERTSAKAETPLAPEQFDPTEQARAVTRQLSNTLAEGKSLFGFMANDIGRAGTSPNLMPRALDLRRSIASFDQRMDQFMTMDPEELMNSYFAHMGPRASLQEVFGTQDLESHFRPLIEELPAKLRSDAVADVKALFDRALGRHLASSPEARWFSSTFRNWNIAQFLGLGLLSQAADVGVAHAAMGSTNVAKTMTRATKAFLPGGEMRKIVDNLPDPQLRALIYGFEQTSAMVGRAKRLLEMDPAVARRGLGEPGTFLWHATRNFYQAGKIGSEGMMFLNGMNRWHREQTKAFRYAALTQLMDFGAKGWDSIDEGYQGVLRSRGVGPKELERLNKLFEKTKEEVAPGVFMPRVAEWPAEMFRKLERTVDATSGAAIASPSLGDMPRAANNPIGAMFFQFSGFAYSIQSRLMRRMVQDPTYAPHMQALMMSMTLATLATGLRAFLNGRGDEWANSWQSPEGVAQNMYETFTRSPFAVAWSVSAAELGVSQFSRPVNNVLQAAGLPPLAPAVSRFRERAGLGRVLGPSFASAERALQVTREGAGALSGDEKEWTQFRKSITRVIPGSRLTTLYGLDAVLGEPD